MEPTAEDAASSAPGSITAASRRGSTAATGAESKDGEKTLAELLAVPEPAPLIPLLPPPNVVIYGAVYSGIPVFEMMCAGTALMRRRQDSFLNLTQILKVANVERGKRMAVLDAACRDGNKFERIQGGYGKYQGTWVPLETAMAVARHFHADKMLAPLLAFHPPSQPTSQMTQDAMRAANVAVRPAPPPQQLQQPRPPQNPHPQQYPQQINTSQPQRPSTPAQARPSTPQQSHAPVQIPYQPQQVQRPQPSHQQPVPVSSNAATSGPVAASSHSVPPPKRKEPEATTSTRGRPRRGARPTDLGESSSESSFDEDEEEEEFEDDGITPPPAARPPRTKRIRTTVNDSEDEDSRQEPQQAQTTAPRAAQPATTTHQTTAPSAPQQTAAPSIPFHKLSPARQSIERQRQILLSIFTGPALSSLPDFLTTANPGDAPLDTDLVIDDAGHTALHWAATLARTNIVESLLTSKLCTPSCTNSNGETPLMRAVLSTNNLEFNAFTGLLALLGRETLTVKDAKGRTVLHHACLGFGVRGHSAAAKYYIENVCRAARATTNENETEEERIRREGFLNVQDVNGDTAMNIAARLGGRAGVDVLLEAGADHRIPNHAGLRPTDFGMDDAFRGKKIVVVEEVKKGDDEDGKDDLLPVGTVGAQSDSVIKKANDLSRG
ncbi:hypothetical protein BCR33DRAFT_422212 [Rhizoclosmatium globosum]|uniref:HTH APSES-type domain-containing protein n=1 Tax=Rhizoclosmatium globosum TaxID=329046 RepID=A0A1Y2BVR6_9FUNG|nr:hypothetical protein BCR33DRAFT_422212 [Rhizoclosmatium globosum]|eukprot:ORY38851.1 hypothetical protein BCR33DRAFT_422212 [Rhizoclosmatium globosum]